MKLGLGLYCHQLDLEHYHFARQCGCTHLMLHFAPAARVPYPGIREESPLLAYSGSIITKETTDPWTYDVLSRLTEQANSANLQIEAIDNLDPAFHLDAILGSSRPTGRLEKLKRIIRNVGKAGIPVLTYYFTSAVEMERAYGRFARGDAGTARVICPTEAQESSASIPDHERNLSTRNRNRLFGYLNELLAVAESVGVTLAASAYEPFPFGLRGSSRVSVESESTDQLSGLHPSSWNGLIFDVAEVAASGRDVYAALESCSRRKRISCVRFGNIFIDTASSHETFVDDGSVDLLRVVRILRESGYHGLITPGNVPQMSCAAPWHSGVAHTLGYLKAALDSHA